MNCISPFVSPFVAPFFLALALLASAASAAEPGKPGALKVCLDTDDAPFSSEATPDGGIHVEVAQALAGQLGRTLKITWVRVPNRGGLGKALRQTLGAGLCDAYFGIPQGPEMTGELTERKLSASSAYLQLGYVLVAAPGKTAPTTASLRAARKIGAVTSTPADLYLHRMKLPRSPYPASEALMAALKGGEIDLALVWSPALTAESGRSLVPAARGLDDDELYTGLTVAVRTADAVLLKDLSAAIDALRSEGRFDAIAQRAGLPTPQRP
jgi:ABC-type amino acid transport substrate-binding protein